jgi:hypothetical protein
MDKPKLDKRIFWDILFEELDFDRQAKFIIERVFERGDVDDIRQCRRFYPEALVEKTLLNAKYLPKLRLHLASAIIGKPVQQFRCYTLMQSNQAHLPY